MASLCHEKGRIGTELESQTRIQVVSEDYDPTLGIMHESREGSSAFVFDTMALERPKVDRCILESVNAHKFYAAEFVIRAYGVCRLNPAMAKRVAEVACGGLGSRLCRRSSTSFSRASFSRS